MAVPGSLRLRCIRALERLRCSVLLAPAFKAAVAARECGECDGGDGGDAAAPLPAVDNIRDVEGDLEGGKEFRSGILVVLTRVVLSRIGRGKPWSSIMTLQQRLFV
jgi:hypothetical protein